MYMFHLNRCSNRYFYKMKTKACIGIGRPPCLNGPIISNWNSISLHPCFEELHQYIGCKMLFIHVYLTVMLFNLILFRP